MLARNFAAAITGFVAGVVAQVIGFGGLDWQFWAIVAACLVGFYAGRV